MNEPIRILYIDDDAGLGRLLARALAPKGMVVDHVETGDEGLARLAAGGVHLVALDHHLAGETGLEVLARIRALPDAPPVVYVTGSEDAHVAVAALKAGAVDYVWKDVQGHYRELLVEAASSALAQERLQRAKEAAEFEVREARDRAELMLSEVNHRVANSLALVSALARLQANAISDENCKRALQEMQARITAIAGVHRRLYTSTDVRTVDLDAYLHSLVEELSQAMNAAEKEHIIRLDAEVGISVPTDKAVSLGVLVTELVTNAYKYAYPNDVHGDIRVALGRLDGDQLRLTVEDDGIGWSGAGTPQGTGVGARIVKAMAGNLRSDVRYETVQSGTRAVLDFAV
jgi:two-component sensor histidine kinase